MERMDESGATAVEYALLLAFVTAILVGTVVILGINVVGLFASVPDF